MQLWPHTNLDCPLDLQRTNPSKTTDERNLLSTPTPTTISKVGRGKSNLLSQFTIHKIRNFWAFLSNHHALQQHITILTKTALVLIIIKKHPLL